MIRTLCQHIVNYGVILVSSVNGIRLPLIRFKSVFLSRSFVFFFLLSLCFILRWKFFSHTAQKMGRRLLQLLLSSSSCVLCSCNYSCNNSHIKLYYINRLANTLNEIKLITIMCCVANFVLNARLRCVVLCWVESSCVALCLWYSLLFLLLFVSLAFFSSRFLFRLFEFLYCDDSTCVCVRTFLQLFALKSTTISCGAWF